VSFRKVRTVGLLKAVDVGFERIELSHEEVSLTLVYQAAKCALLQPMVGMWVQVFYDTSSVSAFSGMNNNTTTGSSPAPTGSAVIVQVCPTSFDVEKFFAAMTLRRRFIGWVDTGGS